MQLAPFNAENDLENAILGAKAGTLTLNDLVPLLMNADIYISSKKEVQQDGTGFDPLLLEQAGSPLVAAFTDISRPALHRHVAEYILRMKGRDLVLRLPKDYGVIINPGYLAQLIFSPAGISEIRKNLATK